MGNPSMEPVSRLSFPMLTPVLGLAMTEIDVEAVKTMTGITEAEFLMGDSVEQTFGWLSRTFLVRLPGRI